MSKFNKLYNLILLSIITEDILSKIKKAIQTLIKSGQLTGEDDPRALQVKTIIKRNNSIDINGKTKLDLLLKANEKYTTRAKSQTNDYLDSIPLFSLKKLYPNGVVIYRVLDSKKGQAAVRKIVDLQWGKESNPWCLITRKKGLDAWAHWKGYNAYPKHIAFQDGKLLAFCANDLELPAWWNRLDDQSENLILKDGTELETRAYKWSSELKRNRYILREDLVYNLQTKRYDVYGDLNIEDEDLIDDLLPVPFGLVDGSFDDSSTAEKVSIKNFPTYINDKNILEADWFGAYFGPYNCYKERAKELEAYFKSLQLEYKKRHNIKKKRK